MELADPVESVVLASPTRDALSDLSPGLWAGFVSYEQGHAWEQFESRHPRRVPAVSLIRFQRSDTFTGNPFPAEKFTASALRTDLDADGFIDRVHAVKGHLTEGDCYQVNLTRRLTAEFSGSAQGFASGLWVRNPAPHFAYFDDGSTQVVSASPELFLRIAGGRVVTSPIKGTGTDPDALLASTKDRAENLMIVDLARNDLGRVAVGGTVRVDALFRVEAHPGLHHLVSDVSAELREGVSINDVFAATFPAASITGAPKHRVVEIIDDLEESSRGVYCGAVGWFDTTTREAEFNVAIRTFTIRDGGIELGVGGGITEASDPHAEWEETELKAARIRSVLDQASM